MHSITIVFGPAGTQWSFMFTAKNTADKAFATIEGNTPIVKIYDDFGQHAIFKAEDIHGVLSEDLDLSANGMIERGLHQARTNAKGQSRAQNDPALKFAALQGSNGLTMPRG